MKKQVYYIVSYPVFAVLYLHTALMVLITLPFAYLGYRKAVKNLAHFWARAVFWILMKKLHIHGIENYSRDQRYIIIANHASLFDIMAIMAFSPDVAWFGHERLMKIPVFRKVLKMINYIPVKQTNYKNTRQILEQINQASKFRTIAIFPEGTRTLDGNMKNFFRGFVYILRASDADILPVTLNGFYLFKPKNRFHINFSARLSVIINQPVKSDQLRLKKDRDILDEMKNIIQAGEIQTVSQPQI